MSETPACREVQDLLPELAAGVADGDARARALAHLAGCPNCRRELEEITTVLDRLLLLAPSHEPPAGFESAVLTSMTRPASARRRPRWVAAAIGTAAAVLLASGVGTLLWRHDADDRQLADQYRRTLAVADGRYLTASRIGTVVEPDVGYVFAYEGSPSWLFLNLESAPSPGRYDVQLVTTDHKTMQIGWCDVSDGKASWARRINVPVSQISRIQLSRAGVTSMSAKFG
jgi:hypothetical protein